ncbi:OB-fold protein [Psychrobacter immobilis]|uniref:OB-fold protein n=1 Tax=Psychrobacter immobilis TaxID=498 RepID=UPI00191B2A57|nr:hypothetical protein [Psychrobacter immobilis]
MKKIVKWIVIILVVLFVIGLIFSGDDEGSVSSTTDTVSTETAIPVTATELYNAYDSNEVGADKQYKGKLLQISGTIESIDSGISDQAVLQLGTGEMFMSVSAEGDDNFTDTASTLSKGQQVNLLCRGAGEVIGMPFVDECVFQ